MRDKVLNISFLVSLAVNLVFLVIVGNSDIFREGQNKIDVSVKHIRVVKPPLPKKPPPEPKIKPPPPPKPVKFVPHPPPPVVRPQVRQIVVKAPPIHTNTTTHTETIAEPVVASPTPVKTTPAQVPAPAPPVVTPPPPPPTPPPAPVVAKPPPPPPPPAPAPVIKKPVIPDRADAIDTNPNWPDVTASLEGFDPSQLSSNAIIVQFDVETDGTTAHAKIIKSSGNNDLDQACLDAVRDHKNWKPAIQDGQPLVTRTTHEFDV